MTPDEMRRSMRNHERGDATRWLLAWGLFGLTIGLPLWFLWRWSAGLEGVLGDIVFYAVQMIAFFSPLTVIAYRWMVSYLLGDDRR